MHSSLLYRIFFHFSTFYPKLLTFMELHQTHQDWNLIFFFLLNFHMNIRFGIFYCLVFKSWTCKTWNKWRLYITTNYTCIIFQVSWIQVWLNLTPYYFQYLVSFMVDYFFAFFSSFLNLGFFFFFTWSIKSI